MELIFEIRGAEEGGYFARALGHSIFTGAENWKELRSNVLEAISLHFEDGRANPRLVQLHYVREELIQVEAFMKGCLPVMGERAIDKPQTGGLPRFPAFLAGNPLAVPGLPNAIPCHSCFFPKTVTHPS